MLIVSTTWSDQNIAVAKVDGDIRGSGVSDNQSVELRGAVGNHLFGGRRWFALEMSGVPYVDNGGGRLIIDLFMKARCEGGELVLVHAPDSFWAFARLMNMEGVMQGFESEEEALAHLRSLAANATAV